jgi:hypothetical protein
MGVGEATPSSQTLSLADVLGTILIFMMCWSILVLCSKLYAVSKVVMNLLEL